MLYQHKTANGVAFAVGTAVRCDRKGHFRAPCFLLLFFQTVYSLQDIPVILVCKALRKSPMCAVLLHRGRIAHPCKQNRNTRRTGLTRVADDATTVKTFNRKSGQAGCSNSNTFVSLFWHDYMTLQPLQFHR